MSTFSHVFYIVLPNPIAGRRRQHIQSEEEEFGGAEAHEEIEEREEPVRPVEDSRMRARQVADVMRCVLFRNIKHFPTRSADISKALKDKRMPRAVVVRLAIEQFKNIFGYEMIDISALDEEEEEEEEEPSRKANASSEKTKKKKKGRMKRINSIIWCSFQL